MDQSKVKEFCLAALNLLRDGATDKQQVLINAAVAHVENNYRHRRAEFFHALYEVGFCNMSSVVSNFVYLATENTVLHGGQPMESLLYGTTIKLRERLPEATVNKIRAAEALILE